MCLYVYVCMYVYACLYTHGCTCVLVSVCIINICRYHCISFWKRVEVCIHMLCMCQWMYLYLYMWICDSVHLYISVCVCVCVCTSGDTYIYIYLDQFFSCQNVSTADKPSRNNFPSFFNVLFPFFFFLSQELPPLKLYQPHHLVSVSPTNKLLCFSPFFCYNQIIDRLNNSKVILFSSGKFSF